MTALLEVRDLRVEFDTYGGTVQAVRGVSFDLHRGKTLAIVGESGCGKSVTVQSIMGLIPMPPGRITGGSAMLDGHDLLRNKKIDGKDIRGRLVGMIFQDPMSSLNPTMTVGDQIAETLQVHRGFSRRRALARAVELIDMTRIPEAAKRARQYPFEFSGGMLQRSMIAMSLACEPSVLIADEPTTALDVTIQAQILDLMGDLQRDNDMAIVLITHDLGVVARMADDVLVMYAGEVVERGGVDDVFYRSGHPYTLGLKAAMPSNREGAAEHLMPIDGSPPDLFAPPAAPTPCAPAATIIRKLSIWRTATAPAAGCTTPSAISRWRNSTVPGARPMADALLDIRGLTKHFPMGHGRTVHAVDDVSLSIGAREIVGLVGESGSGKTTLGRTVLGLQDKTAGEVVYKGETLPARYKAGHFRRYARTMQMIFQDPYSSLNPRMTVGEIVGEGLKLHTGIGKAAVRDKVGEWLRRVGLNPDHMSRYPHEFSGGQRQRIGIARALILEPEFVVCDEPISALDVSVQAQVVNLLDELKESMGLTLLFIAHDLSMVRYVSDRMAVMYLGSLVELGPANRVFFAPKHPYTELLIGSNPEPDPEHERGRGTATLRGEIPSPVNIGPGCRFANRCPKSHDRCRDETPPLNPVADAGNPDRLVACHLYD